MHTFEHQMVLLTNIGICLWGLTTIPIWQLQAWVLDGSQDQNFWSGVRIQLLQARAFVYYRTYLNSPLAKVVSSEGGQSQGFVQDTRMTYNPDLVGAVNVLFGVEATKLHWVAKSHEGSFIGYPRNLDTAY